VLSGCGVFDGSEIHEASAALVSLSREGVKYSIFAPNIPQMHTINHLNGQEESVNRQVQTYKSARIARGNIAALDTLVANDYDAIVFPGGFGAAKNLSTVAVKGPDCEVNDEVQRVIVDFHKLKKPMGFCCIAPTIVAKVLGTGEVTVGQSKNDDGKWPYADTAQAIEKMGAKHPNFMTDKHLLNCFHEIHVDQENRVVTTAAFMCDADFHVVHDGVAAMVQTVLKMA
ncbi:uncharacterized protein TRIADDRAFT_28263, partial [Trichoplax adhaerens]